MNSSETGVHQDLKEALLIAALAMAKMHNLPANMTAVTGAEKYTVLGKILDKK